MDVDRLYEDFRNEIAPRIAEGFAISKDYFEDVSGRLVTYLIVTDAVSVVFWAVAAYVAFLGARAFRSNARGAAKSDNFDSDGVAFVYRLFCAVAGATCFVCVLFAFHNIEFLLSAAIVPEIRVLRFIKVMS